MVSEPGLAYGAAVSWCHAANEDIDMPAALSAHVFEDPTGGLWLTPSGPGRRPPVSHTAVPNMSTLVMNLYYPQFPVGRGLTEGVTAAELDAVDACFDGRPQLPWRRRAGSRRRSDGWATRSVYSIDLVSLLDP